MWRINFRYDAVLVFLKYVLWFSISWIELQERNKFELVSYKVFLKFSLSFSKIMGVVLSNFEDDLRSADQLWASTVSH